MTEDEEFEALEQRLNMKETKQPKALRLADVLEQMPGYDWNKNYCESAHELRRLHALNQELLDALAWIDRRCPAGILLQEPHKVHIEAAFDAGVCARAALAKGASNE